MKSISLLGSTGSIGTQTIDVVLQYPEQFRIVALAAGSNIDKIIEQIHLVKPELVAVGSKEVADKIKHQIPSNVRLRYGEEGLIEVATYPSAQVVLTAVVGSIGLRPTLAAIEAGKTIALANKETLVSAGHLVMEAAKRYHVDLLPVDSEHSAIFQCLQGEQVDSVAEIILTASGGSFRHKSREELQAVTIQEALHHPNWSMGAKITIDSATMMNKGLEVIEAHWLFNLPFEQIKVLLHEESIIHSMVLFKDQAVKAQLGTPDMKVPIQYALTYPLRLPLHTEKLNFVEIGKLHFRELSFERYPCMAMAYEAGRQGGTMPTVMNAANEVAVARFLRSEITFLKIEEIIYEAIAQHKAIRMPTLEEIEAADKWARTVASVI